MRGFSCLGLAAIPHLLTHMGSNSEVVGVLLVSLHVTG